MLEAYFSGFGTGAGLIAAIGAQNAFVLRQGLKREHVGLVAALCIFGDVLCITMGTAGMGAVVKSSPEALRVIQWGGALFLTLYGVFALRRAFAGGGRLEAAQGKAPASAGRIALATLGFTFLNPHVYLDTVVLLGGISSSFAAQGGQWLFALGACTASVLWFCALGFGARLLLPLFARPATWRILDAGIALVMFVIAAGLATARL